MGHAAVKKHHDSILAGLSAEVARLRDLLTRDGHRFDHQFEELRGHVRAADQEQSAIIHELQDWREKAQKQLAQNTVELHEIRSTTRGDIRRACSEFEGKIAEPCAKLDKKIKGLESQLRCDKERLAELMENKATELRKRCERLDQDVCLVRKEKDQVHASCTQHTDNCRAELRSHIEQRFQEAADALEMRRQELLHSQAEASERSHKYTDDMNAALTARLDELAAKLDARYKELCKGIEDAVITAKEHAVFSTDQALRRVDDHLQGFVTKASDRLVARIDAAVQESDQQFLDNQAREIRGGFVGLVAHDALEAELRIMVDRAVHRLQLVSDDIAHRCNVYQEFTGYADERLQVLAADATKRSVPQDKGSTPPKIEEE